MQKDDSITLARTEADSEQNDQDISVSQHSSKPNVSGLPLSNEKGLAVHMICHPERPYQEYVLVSPKDYLEGLTYFDYLKIYKPIVVEELETVATVGKV